MKSPLQCLSDTRTRKILLVTGVFPPLIGGPATFIPHLAQRLTEEYGYRVTVVCISDTPMHESDKSRPYVVHRVCPDGSYRYKLRLRLLLIKGILSHRCILVNGLESLVYRVARVLRRPYILKVVGDPVWELARNTGRTSLDIDRFQSDGNARKEFGPLMEKRRRTALFAQHVVTPSDYLRRLVIEWRIPAERVTTIPNGVDLDRFSRFPSKKRESGPLRVLFVGRLTNWKGVETLLLAMNQVDNVNLTIVGDGPEFPRLVELAKQLNIGDGVRFAGRLPQEEVERCMADAHALVLTSLYEGLSHTLLEAMAAGLPCIASNRGGNTEIIRSGENGILIEPQDVPALAASLRLLEGNEQLRQQMSEKARATSMVYSIDRTVQGYIDLLVPQTKAISG